MIIGTDLDAVDECPVATAQVRDRYAVRLDAQDRVPAIHIRIVKSELALVGAPDGELSHGELKVMLKIPKTVGHFDSVFTNGRRRQAARKRGRPDDGEPRRFRHAQPGEDAEWVNRLEVREDSLLPWISIWEGGSNCIFIISILEKMFM